MNNILKILSIFFSYTKQFPLLFILMFIALFLEAILAIISVLSIMPIADFIYDETLSSPNLVTQKVIKIFNNYNIEVDFYSFGLLFIIINFLKAFLEMLMKLIIFKTKYSILHSIIHITLSLLLKTKWAFISNQNQGKLLNSFTREIAQMGDMLGSIAYSVVLFFQVCIFISIPFFISPLMTFSALILIIIFSIPFLFIQKLSFKLGKKNTSTANAFINHLSETLSSIKLILSFKNETSTLLKSKALYQSHVSASIKSNLLIDSNSIFFQPLSILAIMISIGISLENGVKIVEVAAIIWSLFRAMPIIGKLLQINTSISNFLPSFNQVDHLQKEAFFHKETYGKKIFKNVRNEIEIKNLKFCYSNNIILFNNLSMKFETNKINALTGPSGIGKSSIIDLIMGFQTPLSGNIFIDGVELYKYNLPSLRSKIGYVPQDPQLFDDTIRNNLLWAMPNASDKNIWDACEMSYSSEFINKLEKGLDTKVGHRGANLSGGQRQRITLARALLKKPKIIILDEATSSLDLESENSIQLSMNLLKKTCIIIVIAHRQNTLENADKVFIVKNGKVIENKKLKFKK